MLNIPNDAKYFSHFGTVIRIDENQICTRSEKNCSWCILSGDLTPRWVEEEREWGRDNESEWQSRDFNQYFQSITLSPPLFLHVTWHHAVKRAHTQRARQRDPSCNDRMWSSGIHTYTITIPLPLLLVLQERSGVCASDWTASLL